MKAKADTKAGLIVAAMRHYSDAGVQEPIQPEDLLKATRRFKADTALGIDQVDVWMWQHMTLEQATMIAEFFNNVERCGAWPKQILMNIIVLMGKPTGGVRPIALMPMAYRLWTKVRRDEIVD